MRIIAALPVLALAACAPTAAETAAGAQRAAVSETKLERALAGLVPGQPVTCLPPVGARQYQVEGYGKTILYKYSRGMIYRNDTSGGCERIAQGDTLITRQPIGRLCSGDIAFTADLVSRFQTGSCSFGEFVPYRRP